MTQLGKNRCDYNCPQTNAHFRTSAIARSGGMFIKLGVETILSEMSGISTVVSFIISLRRYYVAPKPTNIHRGIRENIMTSELQ